MKLYGNTLSSLLFFWENLEKRRPRRPHHPTDGWFAVSLRTLGRRGRQKEKLVTVTAHELTNLRNLSTVATKLKMK